VLLSDVLDRPRHNIVHRLCDRVLGWRTPLFMEPLPDRGTHLFIVLNNRAQVFWHLHGCVYYQLGYIVLLCADWCGPFTSTNCHWNNNTSRQNSVWTMHGRVNRPAQTWPWKFPLQTSIVAHDEKTNRMYKHPIKS
jgi:hypothetical protein